jgi:hypothetical protein
MISDKSCDLMAGATGSSGHGEKYGYFSKGLNIDLDIKSMLK